MAKTLGQALRERRIRRGETQESVAYRLGCDIGTLGRWERHRARVTSCREALQAYLGCDRRVFEELLLAQAEAVERERRRRAGPLPGETGAASEKQPARGSVRDEPTAILDLDALLERGWRLEEITRTLLDIDYETVETLKPEAQGAFAYWDEIHSLYPGFWRVLYREPRQILGYWLALPVTAQGFERLLHGEVVDSGLGSADLEHVAVPGRYKLAFSIFTLRAQARTEENRVALFRSFVGRLVELARAGIFFEEMVAPAYSFEGERLCRLLGMTEVGFQKRPAPADHDPPPRPAPIYHLRLLPFPRRGRIAHQRELAALYAEAPREETAIGQADLPRAAALRAIWNSREMVLARRRICELAARGPVGTGGAQAEVLGFFEELQHSLRRGEISREFVWLRYGCFIDLYYTLLRDTILAYQREFEDESWYAGFVLLKREADAHAVAHGRRMPDAGSIRRMLAEELELTELLIGPDDSARRR